MRGRDSSAIAGIVYRTLADDYEIDGGLVDTALAGLTVRSLGSHGEGYEILFDSPAERPLSVRRWHQQDRVAEEIREIVERADDHPAEAIRRVRASREVIGIEL